MRSPNVRAERGCACCRSAANALASGIANAMAAQGGGLANPVRHGAGWQTPGGARQDSSAISDTVCQHAGGGRHLVGSSGCSSQIASMTSPGSSISEHSRGFLLLHLAVINHYVIRERSRDWLRPPG